MIIIDFQLFLYFFLFSIVPEILDLVDFESVEQRNVFRQIESMEPFVTVHIFLTLSLLYYFIYILNTPLHVIPVLHQMTLQFGHT